MTYETIDLTDPTVGHEWIVTKERTVLRVTMPETATLDAYVVDVVLPAGGVRELVGEWDKAIADAAAVGRMAGEVQGVD